MTPGRAVQRRILVVGVPRSGTTLLQSLLAAHGAVATWRESHFFDRHFRPVPGWPARAVLVRDPSAAVEGFLGANDAPGPDPATLRWLRDPLPWTLRVPLLGTRQADAVARRLLELLDDLAIGQGRATWVEKTPAHLRYLPFLERVAGRDEDPDLVFVHLIRDGLETVASLVAASRHWTRAYRVEECVERWNREVAFSLSRAGSSRDRFVVYEDLAASPEAVLRPLLEDLGLDWQEEILERQVASYASVTAPEEREWKGRAGRAIRASATSEEVLTDAERERAVRGLRRELYEQLRGAAGV